MLCNDTIADNEYEPSLIATVWGKLSRRTAMRASPAIVFKPIRCFLECIPIDQTV